MVKFHAEDTVLIGGIKYILKGAPKGGKGLQFRTYAAQNERGKEVIIKMTSKKSLFINEVTTYEFLKNKKYEGEHVPKLITFGKAYVKRSGTGFSSTDLYAFVLKKHEGITLRQLLLRSKKPTEKEKELLKTEIKKRTEELHKIGLIHGDLYNRKNVLVEKKSRGFRIILLDFATSRLMHDFKSPKEFVRRRIQEFSKITHLLGAWFSRKGKPKQAIYTTPPKNTG